MVKMFMWQACYGALATKANLFIRKITKDPLCSLCIVEVKTTRHIYEVVRLQRLHGTSVVGKSKKGALSMSGLCLL